jgi:hypothetical protein
LSTNITCFCDLMYLIHLWKVFLRNSLELCACNEQNLFSIESKNLSRWFMFSTILVAFFVISIVFFFLANEFV